eukprot:NODE_11508_length_449_cov_13.730061_g10853_i0.p1 GENE.NODE_11508_length_449_cov_13.730061_g10853_i0~~NODE_11508_length_449_cov_13.730061_g10853_i0.p1  ORF type:complete len:116 (+),score=22.58 NODE_11508_length_449_cov_13.730061_g10853_i0:36-383(+)
MGEARLHGAQKDLNLLRSALVSKDAKIADLEESKVGLEQELEITKQNQSAVKCMVCNIDFTMLRRRHTCRHCHRVCCSECAPEKVQYDFTELGLKPTRLCSLCVHQLSIQPWGSL